MKKLLLATLLFSTTASADTVISAKIWSCDESAKLASAVEQVKNSGVSEVNFIRMVKHTDDGGEAKQTSINAIKAAYSYAGESFTLETKANCYKAVLESL